MLIARRSKDSGMKLRMRYPLLAPHSRQSVRIGAPEITHLSAHCQRDKLRARKAPNSIGTVIEVDFCDEAGLGASIMVSSRSHTIYTLIHAVNNQVLRKD
jgi:hypothetical protein